LVALGGWVATEARGLLVRFDGGVFATLICEPVAPFVEDSTSRTGVALDPDGDLRVDDVLDSVPSECASPVLFIRGYDHEVVGIVTILDDIGLTGTVREANVTSKLSA
jgi:hypothetical protein